ncbi:MAG: carboxypeptidase, partial [Algibacter sp.]
MKKILLLFVLTIFGGFSSTAQLITFDDQGHADLAFLGNPYTIGNGGETFIFTLSNGGAAIAANHRYRTTDLEGCNNTDLSYLRGGNSTATTWTIETSSGNELNLNEVRFLNLYECYNFDYVLTITGFKNTVSTGSQPFTVTNSNSVFTPNASFDDVDKIVITTAVDLGNIGIDDINWGAPITPCTDPTIPTITSTPTTVCEGSSTTLNISGTLNDATQWAIYSGTCGGTLVGTATGASPSIVVTPSAGSTTYFVRGEGGCVTSGSCGSTSITTTALDDASFSYSASAYCVDVTDPSATITGLSGGSFSSTTGLSINTSTGAIDVSASTPGLYTVTYTTAGTCPNSSNVNVTVNALDDASFSYSASAYCVDATDPSATITGLSGGSFSSTTGLSINTSTGAIDVSASTPGLYAVTYTTAGTCPNSSNVNVTVNALDDASFSYSASAYCVDATDPSATITGLSGGSFSSTTGLSINTSTGAIDVSASTPG